MAQENHLDFEQSLQRLERKIEELKNTARNESIDMNKEIQPLEQKAEELRKEIYSNLTPWQIVQLSRHPQRPHTLDYIHQGFEHFIELHGDRAFIDDRAMMGGVAWLEGKPVMVMGTQKGKDTKENLLHNFGLPLPEGYRKALRLMKMAEKFNMPVITLVDTSGAYPGMEGEERGVAEAIARNLREMACLRVPIVVVVIGEGGSGGALGIGVGDRVVMLSNAAYTVITPEGCAAILWKDRTQAPQAAEILKLTAGDLEKLGIIDQILEEPLGGAHRDPQAMIRQVRQSLIDHLNDLRDLPPDELIQRRYMKYRTMGFFNAVSLPVSEYSPSPSRAVSAPELSSSSTPNSKSRKR